MPTTWESETWMGRGLTLKYTRGTRGGAVSWDSATSRNLAGSFPDGVIGIFNWHNSSARIRRRSWLRHCATNRKLAGSIPNGVIGIIHWYNPSGRNLLLQMSTRNISWGVNAAGVWGWQPYHFYVPIVLNGMMAPTSWNTQVLSRPEQSLLYLYFSFTDMHFSCYKTVSFPNVDDKLFANSSYKSQWHAYFGILQRFATACQERKVKR